MMRSAVKKRKLEDADGGEEEGVEDIDREYKDVAGAVGKGKGVAGAVGRGRGVEKGVAKSLMLRPKQVGVLPRQKVEKNRRCHQKHAVPRKQSRKSPRQKK